MLVIFLDIDGVLNSQKFTDDDPDNWAHGWNAEGEAWRHMDANAVLLLDKIIQATGAKIVVSSTWRKTYSVEQLQGFLRHHGCSGEVIGVTPELWRDDDGNRLYRGDEIRTWIAENGGVDKFIILDDDSDMSSVSDRLIQTDYRYGLKMEHVGKAIRMLTSEHYGDD